MKRRYRLTKSTDFQRVRRFGNSYAHPLMVLVALPNEAKGTRFGVSAGRSVGKAVKRNRAKRVLRAAIQTYFHQIAPGWDVILIARRPITEAKFIHIRKALNQLLGRASLLTKNHDL